MTVEKKLGLGEKKFRTTTIRSSGVEGKVEEKERRTRRKEIKKRILQRKKNVIVIEGNKISKELLFTSRTSFYWRLAKRSK